MDFLRVFIAKLNFKTNFSDELRSFLIDERDKNPDWKNTRIPYCGIMEDSWNGTIEKFLIYKGAYLVTSQCPKKECDNFMMENQAYTKQRILNIECSLWIYSVGKSKVESIIDDFIKCDGTFYILEVHKFVKMNFTDKYLTLVNKLRRKEKLKNYPNIYKLKWIESTDSYFLQLPYKSTSDKILFLIDL